MRGGDWEVEVGSSAIAVTGERVGADICGGVVGETGKHAVC